MLTLQKRLKLAHIETPLGQMIVVADNYELFLLEFADYKHTKLAIDDLAKQCEAIITPGSTKIITEIKKELDCYFKGKLTQFSTPICMVGTPFQMKVWKALQTIPYGHTASYLTVATLIKQPSACRAAASANGKNKLAIIIPCHRVINHNGKIGGYSSGIKRKAYLLALEKKL